MNKEALYRVIIDSAMDGCWLLDMQGNLLTVNPAYCRMSGYSEEELLSMSVGDLEADESLEEVVGHIQLVMKVGEKRFETRHRRKDGSIYPVEVSVRYVPLNDGRMIAFVRDISEQKRLEGLRQLLANALESSTDAIGMSYPDGRHYYQNRAFDELFGEIGDNPSTLYLDKEVGREIFSAIMGGGQWSGPVRMRGRDGRTLEISLRAYAVKDGEGKILSLVGIHSDITKQVVAEHRHQMILMTAMDGFWRVDTAGRVLEVNEAACRISGYSESEMLSMHVGDLEVQESAIETEAHIRKVMESGFDRFETRHRCKDGSIIDVEVSTQFFPLDGGGFVAFLRDISDRKLAEAAIKEANSTQREAEKIARLGFYSFDASSGIWSSTAVLDELFGISDSGFVKDFDGWLSLVHPDERELMAEYVAHDVLVAKTAFNREYRIIRHNDRAVRWVHGIGRLYEDDQGQVVRMIGTIQDITERKRADEQLEHYRNNLERLVAERTSELEIALNIAQDANRAKTMFLANINHDMRTPLNAVIGITGMLLGTDLNPNQRSLAERINISGEQLLLLINNLLDLTRLEENGYASSSTPFNLDEELAKARDIMTYAASLKGLAMEVAIDPDLPLNLKGDATALKQVILNLLGNAVKFTERGFVRLQVSRSDASGERAGLLFRVTDSGAGIPAAKLDDIFDPFTQVQDDGMLSMGGLGLGLYISKSLISRMGGDIGVKSTPGIGSEFWFSVEFDLCVPKSSSLDIDVASPLRDNAPVRKNFRLLVAEDDDLNMMVIVAALRGLGYLCDVVGNGREALHALCERDYDLVLMDLMMPYMGGVEAARIVRDSAAPVRNGGIPIIALTAMATQEARNEAFAAGMNDFLIKPVSTDMLASTIKRWLPSPRQSGQQACMGKGEVFALFQEKAPSYLAELRGALARNDSSAVSFHAHKLAGAAVVVGAESLTRLARELEKCARGGDLARVKLHVEMLDKEMSGFIGLLTRDCKKM